MQNQAKSKVPLGPHAVAIGRDPSAERADASRPAALPPSADVAVVGAGVIGLSIAWRLARRGLSVVVIERGAAGSGASLAGTGMLAAQAELEPGGTDLLPLSLESQRQWPAFRSELEASAGMGIDYREGGTLIVALSRDEVDRLRFRHELQTDAGLPSQWLSGPEVRAMEPALRPSVVAGIFSPDDHQVDPPLMMAALVRAFLAAGGQLVENCAVMALDMSGGAVAGIKTAQGPCKAGHVVVAAGAWSGEGLLPPELPMPVRPLKGQALAVRPAEPLPPLAHVVWTEDVHLAPKGDGRLIVGATVEERGFDEAVTAGGLYALLEGARRALPSVEEMAVEAVWTGFRPTSDDDAPILGTTPVPNLLIATGHHRNGFLLAPATASAMEELVIGGTLPEVARPFGIKRFIGAGTQPLELGADT
jgi:glycine oxidase